MGQQQLLLLVLGIVIVGLSVVVGIDAFGENDKKSNADAMVADALRIASDCQAWDLRPGQFGGALDTETLANCRFNKIGYPSRNGNGIIYENPNGQFDFENASSCTTAPTIPSGRSARIYIHAHNADRNTDVCVALGGIRADDIGVVIDYH